MQISNIRFNDSQRGRCIFNGQPLGFRFDVVVADEPRVSITELFGMREDGAPWSLPVSDFQDDTLNQVIGDAYRRNLRRAA